MSYFDNPILDTIWLMSCGCDIWHVSLSNLYMLTPSKSSMSTFPVISNPAALMSATIFRSYFSSIPSRIELSLHSIYMFFPGYITHSSILIWPNPTAELVHFSTTNLFRTLYAWFCLYIFFLTLSNHEFSLCTSIHFKYLYYTPSQLVLEENLTRSRAALSSDCFMVL